MCAVLTMLQRMALHIFFSRVFYHWVISKHRHCAEDRRVGSKNTSFLCRTYLHGAFTRIADIAVEAAIAAPTDMVKRQQ